jgi:hypothetical protein
MWKSLNESDEPDVVVFFARPGVLPLFALANFDMRWLGPYYTFFGL